MKTREYNKRKYFLFCNQNGTPFNYDENKPESLNEIKQHLIDYHLIDQPKSIKYYPLRALLDIYEWYIATDKDGKHEIDFTIIS